jgi:choloylglycine hydrolase
MRRQLFIATLLVTLVWAQADACTGISLTTTRNAHVHARTIEWGNFDLESRLIISPQGHAYTSVLPDGKTGLTWTSKLGFVGISVSSDRFIGEGVNEAGLTAGLFYFKGYGSLAPYDTEDTADSITDMDFVRWMLSQFRSVDEVRAALETITIVPVYIDDQGVPSPTAHWRVTDRGGASIVIEIIDDGRITIHNNDVGVLTNSPGFEWQVLNLNNYIHLAPGTSPPRTIGEHELESFGVGTASRGLPGDISPPSRFVRAAFYVNTAPPLETSLDAVSQAFHILHNFDIPVGTEFGAAEREHMPDLPSATQWTAVIDQTNGVFYFTSMHDSAVRKVDLNQIDFVQGEETARPLDQGRFTAQDVTP